MHVVHDTEELRAQLDEWRADGEHVALVPTMGNLHVGHISLVELAREHAERVVVSVFVNPTQFGEGEDFDEYPRSIERDKRRLRKAEADLLFAPNVDAMYPFGIEQATLVTVPYLADQFCGSARPGHFDGVTSVVARLFALVQPDVAVFGQKDYQQQLVIRRMTEDLQLPVQIITAPTIRDEDGLALSSRNSYLADAEKAIAPVMYETLRSIGEQLQSGNRDYGGMEATGLGELEAAGLEPEYLAIRRALDMREPDRDCDEIVVLAAARLGKARLIDNIIVTI